MGDEQFRVTQDAQGNPVYTHNNAVVDKSTFDKLRQQSSTDIKSLKNSITPGIDDDPDIAAMKARARNKLPSKTYAKGGKVSSASKRADGIAQRGKTKGRYL